MSAEADVFSALSGAAAVVAEVGDRIFPDARPMKSALPCIVYQRSGTEAENSIHTGIPLAVISTMDVAAFTERMEDRESLGDAVLAALCAAGFVYENRVSGYDPDAKVYTVTLVFRHQQ